MTTSTMLRNTYQRDSIGTASPATLLTMLYDRLCKDLVVAEQAVVAVDIPASHNALMHAQEIVRELASTLDTRVWPEGDGLLALYQYVLEQLLEANLRKTAAPIRNARIVIEPLRDAWHQAARQLAS